MTIHDLQKRFSDQTLSVSVLVFCEDEKVNFCTTHLQALEKLQNFKVIVQPCAYEAIEFLFRADLDLPSSIVCEETAYFVHVFFTSKKKMFAQLVSGHHALLVAILEQDITAVDLAREVVIQCLDSD